MLLNTTTAIIGPRVVLVPYRDEHVPKYNEWMQDPTRQGLTASDPLTLEEEYEMCRSWRVDNDKLTFIILERDLRVDLSDHAPVMEAHGTHRMIGDVNLFLSPVSPGNVSLSKTPRAPGQLAELEIMIAESAYHGQGLGSEVLKLFMAFASVNLNLPPWAFFAKVGMDNTPSLALFKKLGFELYKVIEVFREVELRWASKGSSDATWPWENHPGWSLSVMHWP